jgi:hypothetical protein
MIKKSIVALTVVAGITTSLFTQAAPQVQTKAAATQSVEQFLSSLKDVCDSCAIVTKYIADVEKKHCGKATSIESLRDTSMNSPVFAYLLGLNAVGQVEYKKGIEAADSTVDCDENEWVKKIQAKMKKS